MPANIDAAQSNAGAVVYSRTNGNTTDTLTLTRPGTSGPITYTYVGGAFWQKTTQVNANQVDGAINALVYGVPTPDAAVPRTGTASFAVDLIGARTVNNSLTAISGAGTTLVDFAGGNVVTVGRVTAGGVQNGTPPNSFTGNARLASSGNSFTGTFVLNDFGALTGTMTGRLFGPAAQEIGAVVRAANGGDILVGALIGRRGSGAPANTEFNDISMNVNLPPLTNSDLFSGDAGTIATTIVGQSGNNFTGGGFSASTRSDAPLTLFYDSATRSYTLIAADRTSSFFPPDYRLFPSPTATEDFSDGARTVMPDNAPSVTLTYTRAGTWAFANPTGASTAYRLSNFTYGMTTPDAAVPRTGTANFRLALGGVVADNDFANLMRFNGTGVLEANFASGALRGLGRIAYREDFAQSGRPVAVPTGNFDLTAQLASNANRFGGTINLTGLGAAYMGALTGRFFGPAAQEIGAAFTVSDGAGGVGSGTLVGARDATATLPAPPSTLLGLTGPTDLATSGTILPSPATFGNIVGVNFDPTTNRYVLSFRDEFTQGAPVTNLTLDASTRNAATSTAALTGHSASLDGRPVTALLSVPGASNPTIALSYTGYASLNYDPGGTFARRIFAHYGLATPSQTMPRSGTGVYNGIVTGHGTSEVGVPGTSTATTDYALTGTGTLTADFSAGSLASTMAIQGSATGTGAARDFGTFTHNGTITGTTFFAGVNGDSLRGQFYGPNAEEFAALLNIVRLLGGIGTPTQDQVTLNGIYVGRRPVP